MLLLATTIRIFINVMLPVDKHGHLNVSLLSSRNRFDFTFLAIWFVEGKYGSTFTLCASYELSQGCGPSHLTELDSNPDFPLSPRAGHRDMFVGLLPFLKLSCNPA